MANAPMMLREMMIVLLPPESVQELGRRHHLDHWKADTVVGSLILTLPGTIEFAVLRIKNKYFQRLGEGGVSYI